MDDDRLLEDRVVGALRAERLVVPRRRIARTLVAALTVAFVTMAAVGWLLLARPAEPAGALYLLALYEAPASRADPGGSRAAEYGRWARDHGDGETAVVGGEELGPAQTILGPATGAERALAGYFLIRAPGPEAALALARTTPHLRYGGSAALRPIVRR